MFRRTGRIKSVALLAATSFTICYAASPSDGTAPAPGSYRLKLTLFVVPPGGVIGLLVRARINGGPPLRLLLDSGTQSVVLDRRAASKSKCAGGTDLDLVGVGAAPATVVKTLTAATVEIGDITLRNAPLLIIGHKLADGIDGALPLSLFADFLIRLDVPAKSLELTPYPAGQIASPGAMTALSSNRLLFLKGTFGGSEEGYFLLDTGASYNAISRTLARRLNRPLALDSVALKSGTADMDAPLLEHGLRLQFGPWELATDRVVAIDLSTVSRYRQLEVSGLIGFPALRDSVLSVNYRDGLVSIRSR